MQLDDPAPSDMLSGMGDPQPPDANPSNPPRRIYLQVQNVNHCSKPQCAIIDPLPWRQTFTLTPDIVQPQKWIWQNDMWSMEVFWLPTPAPLGWTYVDLHGHFFGADRHLFHADRSGYLPNYYANSTSCSDPLDCAESGFMTLDTTVRSQDACDEIALPLISQSYMDPFFSLSGDPIYRIANPQDRTNILIQQQKDT